MKQTGTTTGIISFFGKVFSFTGKFMIILFPFFFFMSVSVFAAGPTVTTNAATSLTNVTAYLNGTANPNGAASTGWFRYSTTNPGAGNDTFGTRVPATGGTSLGSGTSSVDYSNYIPGLSPGTTYYYCAVSQNSDGTGFGNILSFTTAAMPSVTSNAATLVTSNSATLNGTSNPNGNTSYGYFRYSTTNPGTSNDSFGTRVPSSSSFDSYLGSGASSVSYSRLITGLSPGQTFYYCAVSRNSYGISFGAILSFTTPPAKPTANTGAASGLTTSSASLNGSSNPGGAATTGWFRIATSSPGTGNDTFGTRVPANGGVDLGSGISNVPYSITATGLSPGVTYYYCAISQNSEGISFGSVVSFTTPMAPTVNTLAATPVTATTATLNASVNPNGYNSTGWFRYSSTDPGTGNDSFGTRLPASGGQSLGSGTALVACQQPLTGLTPATTYYYCAISQSSAGISVGTVLSFTTPAAPPTVTTDASSLITAISVTLNGTVNANNLSTTVTFEYGLTTGYGTTVSADQNPVTGTTNTAVSKAISGLSPNTTYHYRVIGANSLGTTNGSDAYFTTLKLSQSIAFGALPTKIYGDASFTISATATSGLDVVLTSSDETIATCSGTNGTTITILKAGICDIRANQSGDANYNAAAQVTQTLTINKKTITVSAEAKTKIYGEPDPVFSYTFSPALAGTDNFSGSLTRIIGEAANSVYQIQRGSLSLSPNYTLVYIPEDLTINRKPITVNLDANQTKVYGENDPAFTYKTVGILIGGDNFSGALSRVAGETVGSYAIEQGSLALGTNYILIYVGADFEITKATPLITWNNPADISYETLLSSTQLNATANVAGTFTYTPVIGTKLNIGNAQPLKVDFEPADAANHELATKTVFINVFLATGISEDKISRLVVFPNPVTDAFIVSGIEGSVNISLTDLNGKTILKKEISANEKVYIAHLPGGIYIIKIETANGTVWKKVVKK